MDERFVDEALHTSGHVGDREEYVVGVCAELTARGNCLGPGLARFREAEGLIAAVATMVRVRAQTDRP